MGIFSFLKKPELMAQTAPREVNQAVIQEARAWAATMGEKTGTPLMELTDADLLTFYADWQRIALLQGGVLLARKGETILGYKANIGRFEFKTRRKAKNPVRVGASFRVAKGVYMHAFPRSESVSVTELTPVDQGTVYLTTQRVYFDGNRNIEMAFAKMDTLPQCTKDGFVILPHGQKDVLLKVGNEQDALAWARMIVVARPSTEGG